MKILHVINSFEVGGAEKLVSDLIPLMNKRNIQTDVIALKETRNFLSEKLKNKNVLFLSKGSVYNPVLLFKLRKKIENYDVVHIHLFPSLYWIVFAKMLNRKSNTKLVYTEHSTSNKRRNYMLTRIIDNFVYAHLDFIACITAATKINLEEHIGDKNNIEIINNGIVLDDYRFCGDVEYPFFRNSFKLIQISSFRKQKDQETIINALMFLPNKIKLILVGSGSLLEPCQALVNKLNLEDRVLFLGKRADIPGLLNFSDVVIQSSHYEGFGLAALEGMAANKPVIASDVKGLKEVVGGHGLLAIRNDPKDLAEKVKSLYENKAFYEEIKNKCYLRAKDYSIESMIDKYLDAYKKVLNGQT